MKSLPFRGKYLTSSTILSNLKHHMFPTTIKSFKSKYNLETEKGATPVDYRDNVDTDINK